MKREVTHLIHNSVESIKIRPNKIYPKSSMYIYYRNKICKIRKKSKALFSGYYL